VTEFSNLLRQRLASGSRVRVRPESHPDADTLTAYVERLLPAAERNQVLEHLAACSHCREVAALALPDPVADQEIAATVVPAARRWGFLWSPRFRIAASLATVIIVAMVLFEIRPKPEERAFVSPPSGGNAATKEKQPAPGVARAETPAQPPANFAGGKALSSMNDAISNAGAASALADNKTAPPAAMARHSSATSSSQPVVMALAGTPSRSDYVNQDFFANNASADGASGAVIVSGAVGELPPAPPPRTSNQFPPTTFNAANSMIFADMPTQNTGTQTVRIVAPPSSSSHWGLTTLSALAPKAKRVLTGRRTPAISMGASSFAMGGAGQLNPNVSEAAAAAPALENGANALEQSGAFRGHALSDASSTAKAAMRESTPSPWRVSGGRLVRPGEAGTWVAASCAGSETMEFTTVSAHGNDIWAGGANAALIHSRDGGATCERITLGASAIGTIVRIEARGAVVQVKSSSGQSWSSQDGGKTWKMDE
jgi:hypothetical protein